MSGKEYASTLGTRNSNSKHRSFGGEYASIWESQYPMTIQSLSPGEEETFATPTSGMPDAHGFSTNSAMPPQLPPRVEHIYESPKFDRSESSSRSVTDLPVYFELDPEVADNNHSSTMPRSANDFCHRQEPSRDGNRSIDRNN